MNKTSRIKMLQDRVGTHGACRECGRVFCANAERITRTLNTVFVDAGETPQPTCARCGMPVYEPTEPASFDEIKARLSQIADEYSGEEPELEA